MLIRFWSNNLTTTIAMAILLKFWGLYSLWVFRSLNPCIDFHQIFRVYFSQEDLKLISYWKVFAMATLLRFLGLKVCWCSTAQTHAPLFLRFSQCCCPSSCTWGSCLLRLAIFEICYSPTFASVVTSGGTVYRNQNRLLGL